VDTRRAGTTILYHLAEPELVEACDVIHRIVGRRLASRSARLTQRAHRQGPWA
jgi:hypothetical protein